MKIKQIIFLLLFLTVSIEAEQYILKVEEKHYKGYVNERNSNNNNDTPLVRTGTNFDNLSLVGTNGLSPNSFTSSSSLYTDNYGVGAFDGFIYEGSSARWVQSNPDALPVNSFSEPWNTSWWYSEIYQTENQWLQIAYDREINMKGFRIFSGATHSYIYNRLPKDIDLLYSNDGSNWTLHESFTMPKTLPTSYNLMSDITAKYFRFYIKNNHGDTKYIAINELEIY